MVVKVLHACVCVLCWRYCTLKDLCNGGTAYWWHPSHPYVKVPFYHLFSTQKRTHPCMHAYTYKRATQMTAQHSDLVSMWPRKIKHDSLRTAMGTKSLVQSIQSGQCTWASSQATHLTSTRSGGRCFSRNLQFRAALLRSESHSRQSHQTGGTANGIGRQEDPQVKLCAVFSLEEGTLRTGLSSQAQLQDMQQQQPIQPPPSGSRRLAFAAATTPGYVYTRWRLWMEMLSEGAH